jgi:large subunit ribosomal protein L4e
MTNIYNLEGKNIGKEELPKVFSTPYRPDLIKRAVLSIQSERRQPYGTDPLAGKRTSAHYHGKRRYRFTMMNREMSRIPRIHGKGAGYLAYRARFAPHAVKGRRAHPPKAEKIWLQSLNKKERVFALKTALAATALLDIVKSRGHVTDETPIIFVDDFENISKTKEVYKVLEKIIPKELARCEKKKTRAGKGKMRGRRYTKKKGPVIVVSKVCPLSKSAKNIPGIDVTTVNSMNTELLAPGAHAGRLMIITKSALQKISEKFGE